MGERKGKLAGVANWWNGKSTEGRIWVILLTTLAILLTAKYFIVDARNSGDGDRDGATRADAIVACRNSVRDQLKDPSSAKFRGETVDTSDTTFVVVTGQFTATNSFGGPASHRFRCVAKGSGPSMSAYADIK